MRMTPLRAGKNFVSFTASKLNLMTVSPLLNWLMSGCLPTRPPNGLFLVIRLSCDKGENSIKTFTPKMFAMT